MSRATTSLGFGLGILGAALDFYSSYQILAGSTTDEMGMTAAQSAPSGTAWGVGLASLGLLLAVTALVGASAMGARRMSLFGTLMVAYGVVMVIIGAAMGAGASPTMQTASLTGSGMLAVGALMVANGALMLRKGKTPTPMA